MSFALNTKSGMLHLEDHSGENAETFERADEADLAARAMGKKMQFCKQCFGENRNTLEADRLEELEKRMLAGKSEPGDSLTAPERVRPEAPATSVHSDDAVPAGQDDLPVRPRRRPVPQTNQ